VLDDKGAVVEKLEPDERPRQIERLRAVGTNIRRVVVKPREGGALLVRVDAPHVGPLGKPKS
jgi:hypothetical protein